MVVVVDAVPLLAGAVLLLALLGAGLTVVLVDVTPLTGGLGLLLLGLLGVGLTGGLVLLLLELLSFTFVSQRI